MHAICLGVMRSTMKLILNSASKIKKAEIDIMLKKIKLSANVSGQIPPIKEIESYKAKDYRNMLLYGVI